MQNLSGLTTYCAQHDCVAILHVRSRQFSPDCAGHSLAGLSVPGHDAGFIPRCLLCCVRLASCHAQTCEKKIHGLHEKVAFDIVFIYHVVGSSVSVLISTTHIPYNAPLLITCAYHYRSYNAVHATYEITCIIHRFCIVSNSSLYTPSTHSDIRKVLM